MVSTGLYNFNPAAGNLTLMAFSRIGLRPAEITAQHMADAETEGNLVQVALGNRQPNLWRNELYSRLLTSGTASYDLPSHFIAIRDAYLTFDGIDQAIWPLSTFQYDLLPDKTLTGRPTQYYITKLMQPTITFWKVPDSSVNYTVNIRILTQIQDLSLRNGLTLDLPNRALDVFVAGLAHRLSRIYARDLEQQRKTDYQEAWADFANTDTEDLVGLSVIPALDHYWRQ